MMRLRGQGTKQGYLPPADGYLELAEEGGILEFAPADQMVRVRAGVSVAFLQAALAEVGHCLPLPDDPMLAGFPGTVGGLLAAHLPHALEAQHGPVRDWLLGATLTTPDGPPGRTGSKVVKSVAGYDVHRAACGTWGRGLWFIEATLRTTSLAARHQCRAVVVAPSVSLPYISRVTPAEFARHLDATSGVIAYDEATATVWSSARPSVGRDGWAIGPDGDWQWSAGQEDAMRRWQNVWDRECRWT